MKNEILDDGFENKEERKQASITNWLSIIVLWIGIAYCGVNGLLGDLKVIVAIALLIISTVTTYFNYEIGVKITLGIILIGFINLVDFSPIESYIGIRIVSLDIKFDIILFCIGILHYFTNRKELSKFLKSLFNKKTSAKEIKAAQRSIINGFKRRFSNKPINELEAILNNDKLLPEAKKAAKELLEEKQ